MENDKDDKKTITETKKPRETPKVNGGGKIDFSFPGTKTAGDNKPEPDINSPIRVHKKDDGQ